MKLARIVRAVRRRWELQDPPLPRCRQRDGCAAGIAASCGALDRERYAGVAPTQRQRAAAGPRPALFGARSHRAGSG
jgi:hypothetical protein